MINQLLHTVRFYGRVWLVYAGALFIIQLALAAVFNQAGTGLPGGMGQLIDLLPDSVRGFVGSSELDLLTANGMLAVAYNHPLTKVILISFAVGLTANAVAGELERGTLDLVLARPLRRYKLLLSHGLALLFTAVFLSGIMLMGTAVGARLSGISGEIAWQDFGWLALNTAALILAMGGLGYLCSALSQRGSQAAGWAGGLIAAMFFLDWFATLWNKVAAFAPLSLFHYHKPHQILDGTANWQANIAVLLVVAALTFMVAMVAFERRDLTR